MPFTLYYSPYGVAIRSHIRDDRLTSSRMTVITSKLAPAIPVLETSPLSTVHSSPEADIQAHFSPPSFNDPPSGSGLTPPSSPPPFRRQPIPAQRSSSLIRATAPSSSTPFSTTVTETLVVGPNGLQAVSPTSTITKLEHYCQEERTDDAIALVDEEKRKGRRGEFDGNKVSSIAQSRPTWATDKADKLLGNAPGHYALPAPVPRVPSLDRDPIRSC